MGKIEVGKVGKIEMGVDKYGDKFHRTLLVEPIFKTQGYYCKLWNEMSLWIQKDCVLGRFLKEHPHKLREIPWAVTETTGDIGKKEELFISGEAAEFMVIDSWNNIDEDNIKIEFRDAWPKSVNRLTAFELTSKLRSYIEAWENNTKTKKST